MKFGPEHKLLKTSYFGAYLLISDFLVESLKTNKTSNRDHTLILQYSFAKKNLTHFTNLNSLNIIKRYSRNTTKSMVLVGVTKEISTAPFLDAQELSSRSTRKANVCVFP